VSGSVIVEVVFGYPGIGSLHPQHCAPNIVQHRRARLGLGQTRDVVMIDAALDRAVDATNVRPDFADRYVEQAGWDPRAARGSYSYLVLRPERIQACREANELAGRTLMRDGSWLV
jgi:hypothetical protein